MWTDNITSSDKGKTVLPLTMTPGGTDPETVPFFTPLGGVKSLTGPRDDKNRIKTAVPSVSWNEWESEVKILLLGG